MYKNLLKLCTNKGPLFIQKYKLYEIQKLQQRRKTLKCALEDRYLPQTIGKRSCQITKKRQSKNKNCILFLTKLKWVPLVYATSDAPDDPKKLRVDLHKTMDQVIELISHRRLADAEALLLQCRRLAEKLDSKENLREVEFLVATLALEQKRIRVAEQKLERIVNHMLEEGTKDDDLKLIQVSLQLARVYEAKELHWRAEHVYKFCLYNLNNLSGKSHVADILLVDSLWDYADFAMRRRRYADEQDLRELAYQASVKAFGEIHEYTRDILGNLGRVCLVRGDIQKGKEYLEKAADTAKALVRKDTTAFIVAVGRLFLAGRMYGEARLYCTEGLSRIDAEDGEGRRLRNVAQHCLEEIKKAISPKSS